MKGITYLVVAVASLFVFGNLSTCAYAGLIYETPLITVVNSTPFDIEIERGTERVVANVSENAETALRPGRILPGQSVAFQVPLSKLTFNDSGIRTAAFTIKAYKAGTEEYVGVGPNILVILNRGRSVRITHTYSSRVSIPSGKVKSRVRTSRRHLSPGVFNTPSSAGFHGSYRRYGHAGTIKIPVGETREIEPIVLEDRDISFMETAESYR